MPADIRIKKVWIADNAINYLEWAVWYAFVWLYDHQCGLK